YGFFCHTQDPSKTKNLESKFIQTHPEISIKFSPFDPEQDLVHIFFMIELANDANDANDTNGGGLDDINNGGALLSQFKSILITFLEQIVTFTKSKQQIFVKQILEFPFSQKNLPQLSSTELPVLYLDILESMGLYYKFNCSYIGEFGKSGSESSHNKRTFQSKI